MSKILNAVLLLIVMSSLVKADEGLVLLDNYPTTYPIQRLAPRWYQPRAGDMLVHVPTKCVSRMFFGITTGRPVSHVAIVVEVEGQPLILSAEKKSQVVLKKLEPFLRSCQSGEVIWVRRLEQPLADKQKSWLADWAVRQAGKPYAHFSQLTTLPFKAPFVRKAFEVFPSEGVNQSRWFCSQLVFTAYQVCGRANRHYRASSVDPGEIGVMRGGSLSRPFGLMRLIPARH